MHIMKIDAPINNDSIATFTDSGSGTSIPVRFSFNYSESEGSFGYLDEQGNFNSFSSGGPDISDTTATAQTVLSGYVFYNAQGSRTEGTYVPLDTSDATAYAKNIESGFTAYCRGQKITGTASVNHELVKYTGNIEPLSESKYSLAATSIGDFALFGGGFSSNISYYNTVDAYNSSLSRSVPTVLSQGRYNLAATSNSNYALFGGGYYNYNYDYNYFNTVDAYNSSLSRSIPTALSVARNQLAATHIKEYTLFGGGSDRSTQYDTVDVYNSSLVRSSPIALSATKAGLVATNIGDYALFGGGTSYNNDSIYYDTVDAYVEI